MDFTQTLRSYVQNLLRRSEGACGMLHTILSAVSWLNGKVVLYEVPEGAYSKILDNNGEVVGEGVDITWSPAILKAMINGGFLPEKYLDELKNVLTKTEDLEIVKKIFGYGRIVRPAAVAISKLMEDGGVVKVYREGVGVTVSFFNKNGDKISSASNVFCPACAAVIATARCESLADYVREKLKNETNTGKLKYDKKVENEVSWKDFRVNATLTISGKTIGKDWGCCVAYAIVRAEVSAGLAGSKMGKLLKAYCDQCPVKHVWFGKSMGSMGNIFLKRYTELGLNAFLSYEDYLTLTLKDNNKVLGRGIGSLCALSASVNLFFRSEGVKVVKPEPAKHFPKISEV
ncbi:MAG: hypothetical protein ACKD6N_02870 [Candidatus Bathyarchaeota archaeon]